MSVEKPNEKMMLWNALGKTDPSQTKQFQRAGGFRGTALKPMWVWQQLTEQFGPFGAGWGCDKPEFSTIPAGGELLVFCTVQGWHGTRDNALWGVGGDKVVAVTKNGPKADDEAFKKAFTDALMNAFKFVGAGADIHMGRFDDNKYVQQLEKEFAPPPEPANGNRPTPLTGPHKTRAALKEAIIAFKAEMEACDTESDLNTFMALPDSRALTKQVEEEHEFWWSGDGQDFAGLAKDIDRAIELRKMADAQPRSQTMLEGG